MSRKKVLSKAETPLQSFWVGVAPTDFDEISLIHHQRIICGIAFAPSSLRRIASYASVVAPRRLASDAFLVDQELLEIRVLYRLWELGGGFEICDHIEKEAPFLYVAEKTGSL